MAPSSGGTCLFDVWIANQMKTMNKQLQVLLGVSLPLSSRKQGRFGILGDLGPLYLPTICSAGSLQIVHR